MLNWICFIFFTGYSLGFLPTFGLSSEFYAESLTNCFQIAQNVPFLQGVLITDTGYVPLIPRLASYLVQFLAIPNLYVPLAYDLVATVTISFCLLSLTGKMGRVVLKNDYLRVFFAVMIFFIPNYELKSFLNFSYWLIIPIFLLSSKAWLEPKLFTGRWLFGYVLLTSLAIFSKPLFFAIVPIISIVGLKMILEKVSVRRWGWLLLPLLIAVIHIYICYQSSQSFAGPALPSLVQSFAQAFLYLPIIIVDKVFSRYTYFSWSLFKLACFVLLALVGLLYRRLNGLQKKEFMTIALISVLIIYIDALINVHFFKSYADNVKNLKLESILSLFPIRHWFIAHIAAYFLVLKTYDLYPSVNKKAKFVFLAVIVLFGSTFLFPPRLIRYEAFMNGNADWKSSLEYYGDDLKATASFCIPVNPVAWYYTKNCEVLGQKKEFHQFFVQPEKLWSQPAKSFVFTNVAIEPIYVSWLGLVIDHKNLSEDQFEVFVDGVKVPSKVMSNKIEITYLTLNETLMKNQIEVRFKTPEKLALNNQSGYLYLIARTLK